MGGAREVGGGQEVGGVREVGGSGGVGGVGRLGGGRTRPMTENSVNKCLPTPAIFVNFRRNYDIRNFRMLKTNLQGQI